MKQWIPLLLILVSACKAELPEIPGDVLPMEKMRMMLVDIHIADAVAETKAQAGEDEKKLSEAYMEQICGSHGVSKEEFLRSYRFYETKPVLMNLIYDEVLNELSNREETAGKK
jgi:hypothetical protein